MRFTLIISFILLTSACDPHYYIFLRNNSQVKQTVIVGLTDYSNYLEYDSLILPYEPSIKQISRKAMLDSTDYLMIRVIDQNHYKFDLPKSSTIVLFPISIGTPIREILLQNDYQFDTILFVARDGQIRKNNLKRDFPFNYYYDITSDSIIDSIK
jgi:hypothetical protein